MSHTSEATPLRAKTLRVETMTILSDAADCRDSSRFRKVSETCVDLRSFILYFASSSDLSPPLYIDSQTQTSSEITYQQQKTETRQTSRQADKRTSLKDQNMDQQTANTRPAQSSIRSFFQPLLSSQPSQPTSSNPSPLPKSQHIPPVSSPPPIIPTSSYATSPNHASPTATPPTSQPRNKTTNTTLPLEASILPIHKDHIVALRRINSLLLPISYPDSFYHAILQPSSPAQTNFSRVITWEGKVVGGIVCRLDPSLPSTSPTGNQDSSEVKEYDIYIQSLCLLSPYRSKGLIRAAFEDILLASTIESKISSLNIKGLYAHVWTSNEEALQWYKNRGFSIYQDGVVNGYYRRLKPDTAYIMRRELTISDHLLTQSPPKVLSSSSKTRTSPPPPPSNTPLSSHPSFSNDSLKRPGAPPHSRSFQDVGPAREWNDLPEDVILPPTRVNGLLSASAASSRSSSQVRGVVEKEKAEKGKKKRVYPSAAFTGPPA